MRDSLLFFNIPEQWREHEKENTTEIIHDLLEQKIEIVQIEDARISMSRLTDLIEISNWP
jgi:hypothetical protein